MAPAPVSPEFTLAFRHLVSVCHPLLPSLLSYEAKACFKNGAHARLHSSWILAFLGRVRRLLEI